MPMPGKYKVSDVFSVVSGTAKVAVKQSDLYKTGRPPTVQVKLVLRGFGLGPKKDSAQGPQGGTTTCTSHHKFLRADGFSHHSEQSSLNNFRAMPLCNSWLQQSLSDPQAVSSKK